MCIFAPAYTPEYTFFDQKIYLFLGSVNAIIAAYSGFFKSDYEIAKMLNLEIYSY